MDAPAMDEFRRQLAEAGWRELRADPGFGFGSWSIELEWVLRVEYDGKNGRLMLSRQTRPDNWRTVWSADRREDQTPSALLAAMASAS